MVKKTMYKAEEKPRRITFPVLVKRWVIFLFFMCFFVIFLYAAGSVQGFMDTTQVFLLKLASFFSLFLSAGAFFGFGQTLFVFFRGTHNRRHLFSALAYALLTILGVFAALTAIMIIIASEGNADFQAIVELFWFTPPTEGNIT